MVTLLGAHDLDIRYLLRHSRAIARHRGIEQIMPALVRLRICFAVSRAPRTARPLNEQKASTAPPTERAEVDASIESVHATL